MKLLLRIPFLPVFFFFFSFSQPAEYFSLYYNSTGWSVVELYVEEETWVMFLKAGVVQTCEIIELIHSLDGTSLAHGLIFYKVHELNF